MNRLAAAVTGAVLLLPAASGCAAFSDDADSASDGLQVEAAFYPLQYVAQRVVSEHATVGLLTTPGTEPHDLSLSVTQTARVSSADLVLHLSGFQPAVDDAVTQADGTALDAADVVELEPVAAHAEEHAHEHEGDAEGGHDGHDHGDLDPHFWLDPLRMATLGEAVAEQVAEIDPEHAEDYAANATALRADLEEVDAAYADGLAQCDRHTVVVSHDAFGYLSRYGLEFEPISGLSPDAEPTPADLARLEQLIRSEGVTTVFSERLASPRLAETLATEVGVRTAVLDPIEGLSEETLDEDYRSLMELNLAALKEANGCQ